MNGTYLIIGFFLLFIGVYGYNHACTELTKEEYSFRVNLSKINDLRSMQNYAIAVSVVGAIFAFAGVLDRDPPDRDPV